MLVYQPNFPKLRHLKPVWAWSFMQKRLRARIFSMGFYNVISSTEPAVVSYACVEETSNPEQGHSMKQLPCQPCSTKFCEKGAKTVPAKYIFLYQ